MRHCRAFTFFLHIAILIMVALSLLGCRKKTKKKDEEEKTAPKSTRANEAAPTRNEPMTESRINAFRLVETEGRENEAAQKVWELVAAEARGETEDCVELSDVTLRFFKENEIVGTVTSRKGTFDRKKQSGSMMDDVVGESSEGYRIEAERIDWRKDKEEIRAECPVKIIFGESVIQGHGLTASVNLKVFETHNVKGRVVINEG